MWIRGENGVVHVMDVPLPLGVQHRLDKGDLTRVNPDGSPWATPGIVEVEPPYGDLPPDAPPLPKRSEGRQVWQKFAVSQGIDPEAASSMSKADLISALAPPTGDDESEQEQL